MTGEMPVSVCEHVNGETDGAPSPWSATVVTSEARGGDLTAPVATVEG